MGTSPTHPRGSRPGDPDPHATPTDPTPTSDDELIAMTAWEQETGQVPVAWPRAPIPAIPVAPAGDYFATAGPASNRPGIVTAVGVISIVLGILGVLANSCAFLPIVQFYSPAFKGPTSPVVPAPRVVTRMPPALPPVPAVAPYDGDLKGPEGVGRREAYAAAAAVDGTVRLPPDRLVMLRRLLREFGGRVFGNRIAGLTAEFAKSAITESGQLPAGPDGLRTRGTHFFRTAQGTVLLDDATAQFIPTGGGATLWIHDEVATDAAGNRRRCAAVVAEELDELRGKLGPSFNAIQAAVVAQRLAEAPPARTQPSPGQPTIRPYNSRRDLRWADARMLGPTLQLTPNFNVLADGRVLGSLAGRDPRTGVPFASQPPLRAAPPSAGALPGAKFRASTGRWLIADTVLQVLLSVVLIVAGALVLRDTAGGMALHLRWAVVKVAALGFELWATARFIAELPPSGPPAVPPADPWVAAMGDPSTAWVSTIVGLTLSLIYPVALLFVARSSRVRTYVAGLGGRVRMLPPVAPAVREGYVRSVRSGAGRIVATVLGVLALVAAVGHVTAGVAGESTWLHVVLAVLCLAAGGLALLVWVGRGGATNQVDASVLVLCVAGLLVTCPTGAAAQGLFGKGPPAGSFGPGARDLDRALADDTSSPPTLALRLPADPPSRQVAIAELLRRVRASRERAGGSGAAAAPGQVAAPGDRSARERQLLDVLAEKPDAALIACLNHTDDDVRREAIVALGFRNDRFVVGSEADRAMWRAKTSITELARDPDDSVGAAACWRLIRFGDSGWRTLYEMLGDPDPKVRRRVLLWVGTDRRNVNSQDEREAARKHIDALLRLLIEGPDDGPVARAARVALWRVNPSTWLNEAMERLRAEDPKGHETAKRRLAEKWRPQPESVAGATRLRGPTDSTPSAEALADQLINDPALADSTDPQVLRDAARAIGRRGSQFFGELARRAVSEDQTEAARARRVLEIAAKADLPPALQRPGDATSQGLGFNLPAVAQTSAARDGVLVGELWPRLLLDTDDRVRRAGAQYVMRNAGYLPAGPVTRRMAEMINAGQGGSAVDQAVAQVKSTEPPPVQAWAGAPQPASRSAVTQAPRPVTPKRMGEPAWLPVLNWVSGVIVVLTFVGALAYWAGRRGNSSAV